MESRFFRRETIPGHKSLSNTSRVIKKLNESFKDGLRNPVRGTKSVLREKSKCPEGHVA
jgi:hypothetical protein